MDNIFYSEHITQHGLKALEKAKQSGAEGIIAKRANSKYYSAKRSGLVENKIASAPGDGYRWLYRAWWKSEGIRRSSLVAIMKVKL
ncbi:MAG: hypothetical protein IPI60_20995 [Saprospiraceae bacterium]|nr:hypothetical protein [Saprospiraceae bacterium]